MQALSGGVGGSIRGRAQTLELGGRAGGRARGLHGAQGRAETRSRQRGAGVVDSRGWTRLLGFRAMTLGLSRTAGCHLKIDGKELASGCGSKKELSVCYSHGLNAIKEQSLKKK